MPCQLRGRNRLVGGCLVTMAGLLLFRLHLDLFVGVLVVGVEGDGGDVRECHALVHLDGVMAGLHIAH